jgi:hypothetical protein
MTAEVYWIRAPHHSDMTSEGYVGVSKNANKRWLYGHKWAHTKGRHDNPRLSNAIAKHGWDSLIKTVVVVADEAYCYELENKLRPTSDIGWNLASGGCKPPISKFRGSDYISPLKGVPRPTPWLVGKVGHAPSHEACVAGGKKAKGRKQTLEQVAKRVAARRATLASQGRTH